MQYLLSAVKQSALNKVCQQDVCILVASVVISPSFLILFFFLLVTLMFCPFYLFYQEKNQFLQVFVVCTEVVCTEYHISCISPSDVLPFVLYI
jgi:hypothetical protein